MVLVSHSTHLKNHLIQINAEYLIPHDIYLAETTMTMTMMSAR